MSGFAIKQNGRPMNASAIKLSKVSKRYGKRRVLHDVSFEVHQSELLALVGANGAGKSTLIKIVLGLCEPSSGSVELFGGKSKKELSLMRTLSAMCQIPAEHTNPSVRLRIFGSDVRNGGLMRIVRFLAF